MDFISNNRHSSRDFEDTYRDGQAAGARVALDPGLRGPTKVSGLIENDER
jgi:hypothetical protein